MNKTSTLFGNPIATASVVLLSIFQLLYSQNAKAQSITEKKIQYKINAGIQAAIGDVNIKGTSQPFYGNVFPVQPDITYPMSNHEYYYFRLGFSMGRVMTDKLNLGLGFDVDVFGIGDENRTALPIFLEANYVLHNARRTCLFLQAKPGYSIGVESMLHGGLKLEGALGFELKPKPGKQIGCGITAGYNRQELRKVVQYVLTKVGGTKNNYEATQTNLKNVVANAIPVTLYFRF